jgi:RNA polymerase sigma-70 factor (sigma-E family)
MVGGEDTDVERFAVWARARMDALLRFGAVLAGDSDAAQDLVQNALARTWAAWPRLVRRDDPEGYVRRVMVNEQIAAWRRRRRRAVPVAPSSSASDPADSVIDPGDRLWAALLALAPRQRAVVVLRYCEDRSELDTAALLGCSVGTVKSQAAKGLARLREVLAAGSSAVEAERESS